MSEIDTAAISLRFEAELRSLNKQLNRLHKTVSGTAYKAEKTWDKHMARIEKTSERRFRNIRYAISAIALGVGGREVTKYAETWVELNNKIRSSGELAGRQGRDLMVLAENAREARSQIEPYADLYVRMLRSTKDVAKSEEEVAFATSLAAKSFKAGGAAASEYRAAMLQLSQGLASGNLQGDELRSVRENAPVLAGAIADYYGKITGRTDITIGSLKELGAEGKLTAEIVLRAILESSSTIERAFARTIPTAVEKTLFAYDNLSLSVGKYLHESKAADKVSDVLANSINFVADNVELFADAVVVAGAALSGALGASAISGAIKGLKGMSTGATAAARAMTFLTASIGALGGPWVVGITAAAAALSALGLYAAKTHKSTEELERDFSEVSTKVKQYNDLLKENEGYTEDLIKAQNQLKKAMAEQATQAQITAQTEIEAIKKRIKENENLAASYLMIARSNLAEARAGLEKKRAELLKKVAGGRKTVKNEDAFFESGVKIPLTSARRKERPDEYAVRGAQELELIRSDIIENQISGKDLTKKEMEILKLSAAVEELDIAAQAAQKSVDALTSGDTEPNKKEDGNPVVLEEAGKAAKALLRSILDDYKKATMEAFDYELSEIDRVAKARTEAVQAQAKEKIISTKEAEDAIAQIEATRKARIDALNQKKEEARQSEIDAEKDLVLSLIEERDQLAGNVIAAQQRTFDHKRELIEAEIEDEERKKEALAALAAQEEAFEANTAEELGLSDSGEFKGFEEGKSEYDAKRQELETFYQEKLTLLAQARENELHLGMEYNELERQIRAEHLEALDALEGQKRKDQLQDASRVFGALFGMTKGFVNKQSGIYKTLFIAQKAFSLASALVSIQQNIAAASKIGFPQNLPMIAAATAQGATIASTLSSINPKGYKSGGYTGSGGVNDVAGVVHGQEYVFPHQTTSRYGVDALNALSSGNVELFNQRIGASTERLATLVPQLITTRQAFNVNYSGSPIVIEGNADSDTALEISQQVASQQREFAESLPEIIDGLISERNLLNTPRHERIA